MKLYAVTDEYIDYLRQFDYKVYDNKEDRRKVMRKYLGIVLTINEMNYYIPMSSPKKSDYKDNQIRKSIVPIVRIISNEEIDNVPVLKGTLRISNMIPVPDSELILYEPKKETNKDYKILVEKELVFIEKNEEMIKKYAKIIYNQKINNYDVSYIKNVVDFKLLEEKCKEYRGKGIGTKLMETMLKILKDKGYKKTSLAVQKDNYAVKMYKKVGFKIIDENEQEYIMVCDL